MGQEREFKMNSWHEDAFCISRNASNTFVKGNPLPIQTPRNCKTLTPNACVKHKTSKRQMFRGKLFMFPLILLIDLITFLSNAGDNQLSTCAWSWHDACGHRPWRPWPRRHAWQGSGRTRSDDFVSAHSGADEEAGITYGLVLDLLGLSPLESGTVALVLETLGGNEPLDLGGLGVRLLALTLGLNLAANDVLADLLW
jgi:hypothetical protein